MTASRCWSCEHLNEKHNVDGCAVQISVPRTPLLSTCPCACRPAESGRAAPAEFRVPVEPEPQQQPRRCWVCDHEESVHNESGCTRLLLVGGGEVCPCAATPPDSPPAEPARPFEFKGKKVMSPRQHYEVATRLLTAGLDALSKPVVQGSRPIEPTWQARAELLATVQAHATLATVPQRQFEAWKNPAGSSQPREPRP